MARRDLTKEELAWIQGLTKEELAFWKGRERAARQHLEEGWELLREHEEREHKMWEMGHYDWAVEQGRLTQHIRDNLHEEGRRFEKSFRLLHQ